MSSMNVAVLLGNLTKAPELKQTNGGVSVCEFRLAVNEVYTNRNGEKTEQTLFIDVETWEKQAESCAKFLDRGSQVLVEGRLKLDQWAGEDGQKHSKVYVRAARVQFVGRPRGQEEAAPVGAGQETTPF